MGVGEKRKRGKVDVTSAANDHKPTLRSTVYWRDFAAGHLINLITHVSTNRKNSGHEKALSHQSHYHEKRI